MKLQIHVVPQAAPISSPLAGLIGARPVGPSPKSVF